MRSRLTFFGHPMHPMIIHFPIAFLTGGAIADLLGRYLVQPLLWQTGGMLVLAGTLTGVAAALPGLVDYIRTVPPFSSAKHRATQHLAANTIALLMFAYACAWRDGPTAEPTRDIVGIQLAGLVFLTAGAWLGGSLVTRNQIGVEHRQVGAGPLREAYLEMHPGELVTVARTGELDVGQMKLLHLNGARVVLARTEKGYCAFEDHCPHHGGPLCDGVLIGGTVQCPWHGSQFDVMTGKARAGPADHGIRTFPVEEHDRTVMVMLDAADLEWQPSQAEVPRRSVAMLLLLAMSLWSCTDAAGPSPPLAQQVGAVSDPIGDTFGVGPVHWDLIRLTIGQDTGGLTVMMDFSNNIVPPLTGDSNAMIGFVDFDVDQDSTTGTVATVDAFRPDSSGSTGMGTDYSLALALYAADSSVTVTNAEGALTGRVKPDFDGGRRVTIRIPRAMLGNTSQPLYAAAIVGTLAQPSDIIPENGHLSVGPLGVSGDQSRRAPIGQPGRLMPAASVWPGSPRR